MSPATWTALSGFAIVRPIKSRIRPFPTSVVLPPESPMQGEILVGSVRSIDLYARPVRSTGYVIPDTTATAVREKLKLILPI